MNLHHVWTVFRKDGQELLRDRRTLFVNVVLPVLLYPLMFMFLLQVWQLTAASKPPPPRVTLIGVDSRIVTLLGASDGNSTKAPAVALVTPNTTLTTELTTLANAVRVAADEKDDADGVRDRRRAANAALLARMRADDAKLVYVVVDHSTSAERLAGRRSFTIAKDDAHPEHDAAQLALSHALTSYEDELRAAAADRVGLDHKDLEPLTHTVIALAPPAQMVRSKLAGIIPLLLVVMAVGGAFHPALDLIAGERERGTLETLLSWPVSRRDLFLGKLMVTIVAGVVAVVLNLLSLGVTAAMAGSQFASAAGAGGELRELLSVGAGSLALSFLALLPLIVTVSAISLALAGFAATSKEAQNYLSPLFLVVFMAAAVAQVPGSRPNYALDLLPITGPVLVLKECLRSNTLPWLHLCLSTAASVALAAAVVAWSVRLLDQESFCYPGLVRAGWGRFRRWGAAPVAAGGLEAISVYAICAAGFLYGGAHLAQFGPVTQVIGPLLCFIGLPPLIHAWLAGHRAEALHLTRPAASDVLRGIVIAPLALMLSLAISALQPTPPPDQASSDQMGLILSLINAQGGLPLVLLCIAVAPGICEELLCRGTLLSGLRRGLGPVGAVLISSFMFAVLHLSPYRFLPQFAIGVVLALLALRSGSLLPGMMVHALHNAGAVLLAVWLGDALDTDALLSSPQAMLVAGIATIGLAIALRKPSPSTLPATPDIASTRSTGTPSIP